MNLLVAMNVNGYGLHYLSNLQKAAFVSDHSAKVSEGGRPAFDALSSALDDRPRGDNYVAHYRYFSGADVMGDGHDNWNPIVQLPKALFTDLLPGVYPATPDRWTVNLASPAARKTMSDFIVDEFNLNTPHEPGLFLDNIAHPMQGGQNTWANVCSVVGAVRAGLRNRALAPVGVTTQEVITRKVFCNVATLVGEMTKEDCDLLASACDGFSFEVPLHPQVVATAVYLKNAILTYQKWIASGREVMWLNVGDQYLGETELAYLAMLLSTPDGRSPKIAWSWFLAIPEYAGLPTKLGLPTGDLVINADGSMARKFANGVLSSKIYLDNGKVRMKNSIA